MRSLSVYRRSQSGVIVVKMMTPTSLTHILHSLTESPFLKKKKKKKVLTLLPIHLSCRHSDLPFRLHCSSVFAGIHLLLPHAGLALHVAAPAHLAVTGEAGEAHGRVVAPSTAQTLAAGVLGA